jgi:site-specific DNA-methyltransferase (adenine-specific)
MPISETYNIDCNEFMATCKDKQFDLAIVDPPYGININHNMGRRKGDKKSNYKPAVWDNKPPDKSYFIELERISKNQIIWGANHFISLWPYDSPCWILWDKKFSDEVTFAQFELAWTSFDSTCKKFDMFPTGGNRIHPTQKPVQLYKWLLKNYAKEGDTIFDSHLGSGSSRIACYEGGFDFVGCELDKEYFDAGNKRFENYKLQLKIDF